jgi:outer membrane protein OmpA-like peptidoglycan-associated protein
VRDVYGPALGALPPAPAHFILYFERGSQGLSSGSKQLLEKVIQAVRERAGADVSIVGHTDTTGDGARNFSLGLQRAQVVAQVLAAEGLDIASAHITSHGQDNPLVPTGPNTDEPRNRRVEVTVR